MTDAEKEKAIAGPWEANARDGTLKVRGPSTAKKYKQREVCRIYGANRATVDLIVAAPDMLESLKLAMPHLDYEHVPKEVWFAVCNAIAKAEPK